MLSKAHGIDGNTMCKLKSMNSEVFSSRGCYNFSSHIVEYGVNE